MYRKATYLMFSVLVLSLFSHASAELVGYWAFDEGVGTTAFDSSGNGNDGTLNGSPIWTIGQVGGALDFNGSSDYVEIPNSSSLSITDAITIAAWTYMRADASGEMAIVSKGGWAANDLPYELTETPGDVIFWQFYDDQGEDNCSPDSPPVDEWHHIAATYDGTIFKCYIDGVFAEEWAYTGKMPQNTASVTIGRRSRGGTFFNGLIDEVMIFNDALTQDEILQIIMGQGGIGKASDPDPSDGALYNGTWISLKWQPGPLAVSHDVYLGDNFDDVNDGTPDSETFRGNQTETLLLAGFSGFPYPDGLVFGTTYYWRVDEVEADGTTKYKGDVWSLTIPPKNAYNPNPADGAEFVALNPTLSWSPGLGSILHTVYFGDNFDTVSNAAGGSPRTNTTYNAGPLVKDKTYYWRVDESDGATTYKGDVWSFSTIPTLPITDPSLVGWWKFDEGSGTVAVDWSGHENHGTLNGSPIWTTGQVGGALDFNGSTDYVEIPHSSSLSITDAITIAAWTYMRADASGEMAIVSKGGWAANDLPYELTETPGDLIFWQFYDDQGEDDCAPDSPPVDEWHHIAATYDGTIFKCYIDGVLAKDWAYTGKMPQNTASVTIGRRSRGGTFFNGLIDEVMIFNKALTVEEIKKTMRGDPLIAWDPSPANGSTVDLRQALPLNWSPGDNASQHEVYFGTDQSTVADADASDTTGVYRGHQNATTYTPPEGVEWAGGPYFWRVDEINTDGSVSTGSIWSFSVADFVLVDDFESYNDIPAGEPGSDLVYIAWVDGFDNPNVNGSTMGYVTGASMETGNVHSGRQSVPFQYNNTTAGVSEVVRTFTPAQDWTANGVTTLSLWFFGDTANTSAQLYAKINGVQVNYDGDAADLSEAQWHRWSIDLTKVGTNLQSVSSLAVGVQGVGAIGTLLLDDIALYR